MESLSEVVRQTLVFHYGSGSDLASFDLVVIWTKSEDLAIRDSNQTKNPNEHLAKQSTFK
jgi:hypothetical protein